MNEIDMPEYTFGMKRQRNPVPYRDLSALLHDCEAIGADGATGEQTRGRVVRALGTFDRAGRSRVQAERIARQVAIVSRCDLAGALHKVVAADLGISMRTFYRERTAAFERLRQALADGGNQPALPAPPSALAARLERARVLAAQGRLTEAATRLGDLATLDVEPVLAAAVHARLAGVFERQGERPKAAEALARAKRFAAQLGNGSQHAVAEAEIAVVEAARLRAAGHFNAAAMLAAKIASSVAVRSARTTPSGMDAHRAATLLHVETALDQGNAALALSIAVAAQTSFAVDGGPSDVRLELALCAAEAQTISSGDAGCVLAVASDAYATASADGLHRYAARALRLMALAYAHVGDVNAGRECVRTAREIVALLAGSDAAFAACELAAACIDLNDAASAKSVLAAIPDGTCDGMTAVLRVVRDAEVLLLERRQRDALTRAKEAALLLGRSDSRRYLGEATFVTARALAGTDDHRAARAAAAEAATLLAGASWPTRASDAAILAGRQEARPRMQPDRRRMSPPVHVA